MTNRVQSAPVRDIQGQKMGFKSFRQPSVWDFGVYDHQAQKKPDTSTPLKKAVILLEDEVRHDALETGAFFANDGRILVRRQGEADTVRFSDCEARLAIDGLFTHNHPKGGNFSLDDVIQAAMINVREVRVVTPYLRYSMARVGSWPAQMAIEACQARIASLAQVNVELLIKDGSLRKQYAQIEVEHQFWSIFAFLFGLNYSRERS